MRAVVFQEPGKVSVEQVEDPKLIDTTDAIMRVTTAAICGSDLHMYEGRAPVEKGLREAYDKFDKRVDGCTKVLLKPGLSASAGHGSIGNRTPKAAFAR